MSPTSPTFFALHQQLNKAHRRIRELEARETDYLAQISNLSAVIAELTHETPARTIVELNPSPQRLALSR